MINEKVHELIEKNRALFGDDKVSFDGVVDEAAYLKSEVRTAFLLKETNLEENEKTVDWEYMHDLRDHVMNESKELYTTWPNACLWIELLKHPEKRFCDCLNENGDLDKRKFRLNMLEVAIVNLKKTHGSGSSNYKEIYNATINGAQMLCEEIDIINPQLIICGGTFMNACMLYNIKEDEKTMLSSGAHYFIRDNRVFLEFVHPIWYTVNRRILFAYAKTVFPEIMEVVNSIKNRV